MYLLVTADKSGDRTIIGAFHLRREKTAGQLVVLPVIGEAFTAKPFAAARLIGASAFRLVRLH
jgi:hypothetical protein